MHFTSYITIAFYVIHYNCVFNFQKDRLSPLVQTILRNRLKPDYYVYNYFTAKFDALVKGFGEEQMAIEVEKLRLITQEKINGCNIVKTRPKEADGPETAGASKVITCYVIISINN